MTSSPLTIGLISDTHMPDRWDALPESIPLIFRDVDLILHAGDVGELWVLDQLSAIAPVIAVHGNDESHETQRTLPYRQIVAAAGRRILLTHGHWQDATLEAACRREDDWAPKLDRWAEPAIEACASIMVFGHTHIPMTRRHRGVLIINPGAIASASWRSRQTLQTVAVLRLEPDQADTVRHIDVWRPDAAPEISWEWERGFSCAAAAVGESFLAPDLEPAIPWVRDTLVPIDRERVREVLIALALPYWTGTQTHLTAREFACAFRDHPNSTPALLEALRGSEIFGPLLHNGPAGTGPPQAGD